MNEHATYLLNSVSQRRNGKKSGDYHLQLLRFENVLHLTPIARNKLPKKLRKPCTNHRKQNISETLSPSDPFDNLMECC